MSSPSQVALEPGRARGVADLEALGLVTWVSLKPDSPQVTRNPRPQVAHPQDLSCAGLRAKNWGRKRDRKGLQGTRKEEEEGEQKGRRRKRKRSIWRRRTAITILWCKTPAKIVGSVTRRN